MLGDCTTKPIPGTSISHAVNTASRVESMTKKAGAELLVSGDVYKHIAPHVVVCKPESVRDRCRIPALAASIDCR